MLQNGTHGLNAIHAIHSSSADLENESNCIHTQQVDANSVTGQDLTRNFSSLKTLSAGDRAYFGWSDVSFKLSAKALGKSKKDPRILKNQKGTALPGEVVAIMGASGCGKTSLLNVLSGRIVSMNGHEVKGNFSINGIPIKPEGLGPKVAFVTQEDTLCPTATPREALDFSARLRLPPFISDEERKQMVNEAIEVLRLERCADSIIGDDMIKGISGGEKR
jgi:ABC-type glutathione transport system ATPase component